MANVNVNIRMDSDLKHQFEKFCEISGENPNSETKEAIQEVKRMKTDPSLGKTYTDVDQMMEDLLSNV